MKEALIRRSYLSRILSPGLHSVRTAGRGRCVVGNEGLGREIDIVQLHLVCGQNLSRPDKEVVEEAPIAMALSDSM
jgi:hypothetical protein